MTRPMLNKPLLMIVGGGTDLYRSSPKKRMLKRQNLHVGVLGYDNLEDVRYIDSCL